MQLLRDHVPLRGDERILDIGSQVDNQSRQILERIEDKRNVTAVNLLGDWLDEIQAAYPGIRVMRANACELPFADKSFDLVYSFKVLAHVEDIDRALKEIARVTRRGGHMVLEFYNPLTGQLVAWVEVASRSCTSSISPVFPCVGPGVSFPFPDSTCRLRGTSFHCSAFTW